jgi:hypothetical protein
MLIMPVCTKSVYRILMLAGIIVMRNGIVSIVYTLTPVDVPHNGTVRHGLINILAPNMNRGSIACIV